MDKVCIITNIPSPYRVDLFYTLQQNLSEYDFYIIFTTNNEDNRKWKSEVDKLKNFFYLDCYTIKIKEKIDIKYLHIPKNVNKLLDKIHPDIVISSEYNMTSLKALNWCKRKKKKYISWSDGTLFTERNINILQKLSRKYICKHANSYIASSSKTKEAQIHYGAEPDKVFISYLTVDTDKYKFYRKTYVGNKILFVGRLVKLKGLDLLFNALSKIDNSYELTIVGDGDAKEELVNQVIKLGLKDKISFVGEKNIEEVVEYYRQSDIFILPTRQDCYGLVLLEACCATMVVISSKYAEGAPDIIENNVNGVIVDPYDENEFTNVIKDILSDKQKSYQMAINAYNNADKFNLKNVISGFKDAIEVAKVD